MSAALQPLAESQLDEKASETLLRLRDLFGEEPVPNAFLVYANVPAFMQDVYVNVKRFVLTAGKLDLQTKLLVAYCASLVLDCREWRDVLFAKLKAAGVADRQIADAASIAATCSMYNVVYTFRDLAGDESFRGMPIGLRAFAFGESRLDPGTVETINAAVSELNGCKPCTAGHVAKALTLGVSHEALLEAVHASATIAAAAVFLRAAK